MSAVEIVAAGQQDWEAFRVWAGEEGWRVPGSEIAFHRHPLMQSAWSLHRDSTPIGFVTAVAHERSGWIGNLLIPREARGRGYGALLFDRAAELLMRQGVQSIWLTASSQGEQLYRRRGFAPYGRVTRWVRREGGAGETSRLLTTMTRGVSADASVWGESRHDLLAHVSSRGTWLVEAEAVALLQQDTDRQILGPWVVDGEQSDLSPLLEIAVNVARPARELVVDLVMTRQTNVEPLIRQGFESVGETRLMACGNLQGVNLQRLRALASLGSIG